MYQFLSLGFRKLSLKSQNASLILQTKKSTRLMKVVKIYLIIKITILVTKNTTSLVPKFPYSDVVVIMCGDNLLESNSQTVDGRPKSLWHKVKPGIF